MAKLLQPNNSGAAPRRVTLKTSGPAPKTTLRLKGADGKAIEPKKTPAPKPAAEPAPTAAPAAAEAPATAEAQAAAEAKAAEEAAAAEAARLAQEEYERQMEEYNRQMEEYNRQMAEYEAALAAEAAAAEPQAAPQEEAAEAPTPEEAPAAAPAPKAAEAKLSVAKPAGLNPAGAKAAKPAGAKAAPKAKAKPAATAPVSDTPAEGELSEEDAAREAYLEQLQKQATAPKIWQTPIFKYGCIGFAVALAGVVWYASGINAENKKHAAHHQYINQYLKLAADLNKQQIETLADIKAKGVTFNCPPEAAKDLMGLVVDPFVKREDGRPRYGGDPKGVALNACLVLGIAAEQNPEIDKMIFATLGEKCDKMDADIFSWLLQRLSVSNNKGVKGKLKKLAKQAAEKPKWRHKSKALASIWSCIGLRVSPKDVDEIIALLGDESIDDNLAKTLSICLGNVLDMMEDPAERAKVGDEVFTKMPEKYRKNILDALGKSLSPKALEFYKAEMEDPATWTSDGQVRFANAVFFFQFYGSDDIIDYLLTLKEKAAENPGQLRAVENSIQGVFVQNRERTPEDTERLLGLIYENINEDTSAWDDIINKTDPYAADFVGEDSPEYESLMEKKNALEKCRKQKTQLINALGSMRDFKWVLTLLEGYSKDADSDIATLAERAIKKVQENTAAYTATRTRFKARGKE